MVSIEILKFLTTALINLDNSNAAHNSNLGTVIVRNGATLDLLHSNRTIHAYGTYIDRRSIRPL